MVSARSIWAVAYAGRHQVIDGDGIGWPGAAIEESNCVHFALTDAERASIDANQAPSQTRCRDS